jgi:hypothetical protein
VTGAAGSGTTLARVSTFKKLKGYDVNFKRYSDTDFLIRFAQMGGVVVGIQESLMNQGMTFMGLMNQLSLKNQDINLKID